MSAYPADWDDEDEQPDLFDSFLLGNGNGNIEPLGLLGGEGQPLYLGRVEPPTPEHPNCRCVVEDVLYPDRPGFRDAYERSLLAEVFGVPVQWALEYAAVRLSKIPQRTRKQEDT